MTTERYCGEAGSPFGGLSCDVLTRVLGELEKYKPVLERVCRRWRAAAAGFPDVSVCSLVQGMSDGSLNPWASLYLPMMRGGASQEAFVLLAAEARNRALIHELRPSVADQRLVLCALGITEGAGPRAMFRQYGVDIGGYCATAAAEAKRRPASAWGEPVKVFRGWGVMSWR
jgi:hypothetical protein